MLLNVHCALPFPNCQLTDKCLVSGNYLYYHYLCDGVNDRGWGCGYRTLQTLMSWVRFQEEDNGMKSSRSVATLKEIQEALVAMGDKLPDFIGSREWIGSIEVSMCLDYFYNVPCKIIHVPSGSPLEVQVNTLKNHFQEIGSPVMMGGDVDSSSKCILGVCKSSSESYLLVLDPHFSEKNATVQKLEANGWIRWWSVSEFCQTSFYNLCLPQYKKALVENKKV